MPLAGGAISAYDQTYVHSGVQPARVLAVGALAAAVLALIAVLATSVGPLAASSRVPAGRAPSTRLGEGARRLTRSQAVDVRASPSFTLPFAPDRADRATRPGEAPSLYDDGLPCSTGCRPYGAEMGWPLKPFHIEHPIRAGLNELRPESMHVGIDIQARDVAQVFAVQPGVAQVLAPSGPDARVQVGNYIYWHISPRVRTGQRVTPFETVLGTVMPGYGHMAFSELGADGQYANPLRPGGTVLEPYADRVAPEIGSPAVSAEGQVTVSAYDPQSFVRKTSYYTPVLAPAAIAYRLYDSHGAPITPLEWSFRGTHLLQFAQRSLIYAPGARAPGYGCFASRSVCVPNWTYRVADGLAPPLPVGLQPGHYRLTIYAWDWADNTTALDTTLTMTATGWRPVGRFPHSLVHAPGYLQRYQLLPPAPVAPRFYSPTLGRAPSAPGAIAPTAPGDQLPPPTTPGGQSPQPATPGGRVTQPATPGAGVSPPASPGGPVRAPAPPGGPGTSPATGGAQLPQPGTSPPR